MYGKGRESSDSMYKQEMDILFSGQLKLIDKNRSLRDQLASKKNTSSLPMNDSSQIISETARPGKFILRKGFL